MIPLALDDEILSTELRPKLLEMRCYGSHPKPLFLAEDDGFSMAYEENGIDFCQFYYSNGEVHTNSKSKYIISRTILVGE